VRHDWPGNVRELQNCIQRAALLSNGAVLRAADLGLGTPSEPPKKKKRPDDERASLVAALREHDWNVIETCRDLGIPRASFYRKLRRYRIERPRDGSD
jgi:two-component system NtrC family response regulator